VLFPKGFKLEALPTELESRETRSLGGLGLVIDLATQGYEHCFSFRNSTAQPAYHQSIGFRLLVEMICW